MNINNHEFSFDTRVAYADTDRMGVVYYANYFTMFERGRTELMRNMGLRYRDMEEVEKVFLPVVETHCNYLKSAKYDDLIRIVTRVRELGGASIIFDYDVYNAETNDHLAQGYTRHPFVNMDWKPVRVPASFKQKFLLEGK